MFWQKPKVDDTTQELIKLQIKLQEENKQLNLKIIECILSLQRSLLCLQETLFQTYPTLHGIYQEKYRQSLTASVLKGQAGVAEIQSLADVLKKYGKTN